MTAELVTNGGITPGPILPNEREDIAHVLILGGVESPASRFSASEALQTELNKQDLRVSALHQGDANAAIWLTEAGIELISMAGLRNESGEASAIGFIGVDTIGAGDTESMANRPFIHCVNGIRLGVVSLAEQTTGAFNNRADILSLAAFDRVRMLINQCDHVIVLVRTGLDQAELPLPEWRARYRRFIDAGASAVVDTGCAKGWEAYKHGLVFYGLGSPAGADSLGLFLSLQRNGKLTYEARALQNTAGLDFSVNDAFRQRIDAQNVLFTNEKYYLRAANEMCQRLYCEIEPAQKRGVLGLFSSRAEEEQRLLSLLENESRRLMTLRAIRLKQEAEKK
ncbi:MAG: CapA family protein [Christensenella sp.]|nr:CapA family protein [Christensenella sp.]